MAKKVTLGKLFVEIELLKFILSIAGKSYIDLKRSPPYNQQASIAELKVLFKNKIFSNI